MTQVSYSPRERNLQASLLDLDDFSETPAGYCRQFTEEDDCNSPKDPHCTWCSPTSDSGEAPSCKWVDDAKQLPKSQYKCDNMRHRFGYKDFFALVIKEAVKFKKGDHLKDSDVE